MSRYRVTKGSSGHTGLLGTRPLWVHTAIVRIFTANTRAIVVEIQVYRKGAKETTEKANVWADEEQEKSSGQERSPTEINLRLAFSEWRKLKEKESCSCSCGLIFSNVQLFPFFCKCFCFHYRNHWVFLVCLLFSWKHKQRGDVRLVTQLARWLHVVS